MAVEGSLAAPPSYVGTVSCAAGTLGEVASVDGPPPVAIAEVGAGPGISPTVGVPPDAVAVAVENPTCGTVIALVSVEVSVLLTVMIWETEMVVHGTVVVCETTVVMTLSPPPPGAVIIFVTGGAGGAVEGGGGGGPTVIEVGTSVMMPGFSGMCAAQIPVKYERAAWICSSDAPQDWMHWITAKVKFEEGQKQRMSLFDLHSGSRPSQVFRHLGTTSGHGAGGTGEDCFGGAAVVLGPGEPGTGTGYVGAVPVG